MDTPDKISRLRNAVKSGNQELCEQALEEIKTRGDESYIRPLTELLHTTIPGYLRSGIFNLFGEIKHEKAAEILVEVIKDEKDPDIKQQLVSSCWQNGLNYSANLPFFTELVLDEDFQVAFEAFTVIENMYGRIDPDTESMLLAKIQRAAQGADEKKQFLLKGLTEIIPNIPLNQDPVDF